MTKKLFIALVFCVIFAASLLYLYNRNAEKANNEAAKQQMASINRYIADNIDDVDVIIDDAYFAGNVSGTGNNTELLTVSVFISKHTYNEIKDILDKGYKGAKLFNAKDFDKNKFPYNNLQLYPVSAEEGWYVVSYAGNAPFEFTLAGA